MVGWMTFEWYKDLKLEQKVHRSFEGNKENGSASDYNSLQFNLVVLMVS